MEIIGVTVFKNSCYDGYNGVEKGQYFGTISLNINGAKLEIPVNQTVVNNLIADAATCVTETLFAASRISAKEIVDASISQPVLTYLPEEN